MALIVTPAYSASRPIVIMLWVGSSAALLASRHSATGAPKERTVVRTMIRDEKLTGVSTEGVERHPGRREKVNTNGNEPSWRRDDRSTRESREDPGLILIERLVDHGLLEFTVHRVDVRAVDG